MFPYAYIRGEIVPSDQAVIPISAKVIQYGLGIFAGMRGNWNNQKNNLFIFRMEDHFKRMREGAKILGMKWNMDYNTFESIVRELIKKAEIKKDIYIRPVYYASSTNIAPTFADIEEDLAIYIISLKEYLDTSKGLNLCVSSWRRFDDDMMSTKAKLCGGYANSALAKSESKRLGFDDAIFLNRDGKVCEGSGANIFGAKDGVVYTPPIYSNILNGITRRSLIDLLKKEMKLEVKEEQFDRSTLYTFDECWLSGTAAKMAWIREIDGRTIGNGEMGEVSKGIKELFERASLGNLEGYEKWNTGIY